MKVSSHVYRLNDSANMKNLLTFLLEPKKQIFLAFSVYTNGRSLLSCKKSKSKDVMDCVHGIRVISTQWVVLGHTYMMFFALPSSNGLSFISKVSSIVKLSILCNNKNSLCFCTEIHKISHSLWSASNDLMESSLYSFSRNTIVCICCQHSFRSIHFSCLAVYLHLI